MAKAMLLVYSMALMVLTLNIFADVTCVAIQCYAELRRGEYALVRAGMAVNYMLSIFLIVMTLSQLCSRPKYKETSV